MARTPRLSGPVILGVAGLALAAILTGGGFAARYAAGAAQPVTGQRLSGQDARIVVSAASSCPALTPARLAGQVMAASGFGSGPVAELRDDGRAGVAALTPEQWRDNQPWPGADPADHEAGITALAHLMCRQIGQARTVKIDGDPWRTALAGYRVGADQVVAAGRVPAGAAADYVATVERYASWYATQPLTAALPAATADAAIVAVPDAYAAVVVAAGKLCPAMPPARIAAQIMATSGFQPGKLGPAGEQGIAQFLPQVWTANAAAAGQHSPWDPSAAIPALGRTMCRLVQQAGGEYADALTAFTGGTKVTTAALLDVVTKAEKAYGEDARLKPPKATGPVETLRPVAPATTHAAAQPPIKGADGGSGGPYGPYAIRNLTTHDCATGAGTPGAAVVQSGCATTGTDGQRWVLEPRGDDKKDNELFWIRNAADKLCLDPPGAGTVPSSAELSEANCLDKDNQYFRLEKRLVVDGLTYYWLRNAVSDMCLDVPGVGDSTANLRLALVPCKSGDDHEWALT